MSYINDDYITLDFKNGSFYYGYEVSKCLKCNELLYGSEHCQKCDCGAEWCFQATYKNKTKIIPFSELGTKDMHDMYANIAAGISVWISENIK